MDTPRPQRERERKPTNISLLPKQARLPPPPPPPSSTTSPSHDFSFTISLHPPLPSPPPPTTTKPSSAAIDLSPADDIFLHGHLLPLDILSTARASTDTTIESCRRPVDRVGSDLSIKYNRCHHNDSNSSRNQSSEQRAKHKPSPFLYGLGLWRKDTSTSMEDNEENKKCKKRGLGLGLDLGHLFKKYASMVEQLFSSKGEKERRELRRRPHSFSVRSTNPREARDRCRRRRGQLSAPASLRTSPANSGHLSVGGSVKVSTSSATSDESTMEELQSAIQAAIAHCKNSIAAAANQGENCKC